MAEWNRNEIRKLYTRLSLLKTERATWWSHWQEISAHFLPRSGRFFTQDRNRGNRRHNAIYDNTGLLALKTLGAGMMAGATSPARPWFAVTTPDKDLARASAVRTWMSQVTGILLAVFAKSNTYRALHQVYNEEGAFGTAATIVMPDYDNVIHHYPLTVGEYSISANARGRVDTLYREFQMTTGQLVKEFGLENCSTTVKSMFGNGVLDAWVTVVHVIEPREDRDTSKRDALNMPWRSVYFELGRDCENILRESGHKDFPALAPRWETCGGDIYGNSPGMAALGDCKQLQVQQLRKGQAIDKMTDPPLQAPTGMKNYDIDRLPGGITYYDQPGNNQAVRTLYDVNLPINYLLEDIRDVRERIRSAFYADLFLMLSQQSADGRMTATEVAERHEEKLLMLGPVIERQHDELLSPLVTMTFQRCLEVGILPPPPAELQGQQLNIEFVSMLAQAQKAVGTNAIDRFVVGLGQIAQFKPGILDKFDENAWADIYSDALGVDPQLIVANDKVALIQQQRAQAAEAQQRAEQANQMADTAQKLAGANVQPTNVIDMYSGYNTSTPAV